MVCSRLYILPDARIDDTICTHLRQPCITHGHACNQTLTDIHVDLRPGLDNYASILVLKPSPLRAVRIETTLVFRLDRVGWHGAGMMEAYDEIYRSAEAVQNTRSSGNE